LPIINFRIKLEKLALSFGDKESKKSHHQKIRMENESKELTSSEKCEKLNAKQEFMMF